MKNNKQIAINMITSFATYAVQMAITLLLPPYIVKHLSIEAYGFVAMGNSIAGYASIITIALTSVGSRFIAIEMHSDDEKKANVYFTSIFFANLFLSIVMLIITALFVWKVDRIINVPPELLADVQVLFLLLLSTMLASVMMTTVSVGTFVKNKLNLQSMRQLESYVLRAILTIVLFMFFKAYISYVGLANLIAMVYVLLFGLYYTKKLVPELRINRKYFQMKAVLEIFFSGIWNIVGRIGQILTDGADFFITNIFLGATAAGELSIAKVIPAAVNQLIFMIGNAYAPSFTELYAKKKFDELKVLLKQSMSILGLLATLPIAILAAFGSDFFALWVPGENARLLQALSLLIVGAFIFTATINTLYSVFTVTNRLKVNALWVLGMGALNIVLQVVVLNLVKNDIISVAFLGISKTTFSLLFIAGVSSILMIFRNLVYTVPYGAKYLGYPWHTFFPETVRGVIAFAVAVLIGVTTRHFFPATSWLRLVIGCGATAVISILINLFVMLRKKDRVAIVHMVKSRLQKKKA